MRTPWQRAGLVAVPLLLAVAGAGRAQDDRGRGRDGLIDRIMHLMPPAAVAELDLTDEQRKQVADLEKQFNDRRQATLVRTAVVVAGIMKSLEKDDDKAEPAPVLAIAHQVTGALLEMRRARAGYEKKMLALLQDEQRQRFLDLREAGPRDRRPRSRGVEIELLLSRDGRDDLRLTPEQRKQLAELRRDFETRLRGILTPEQKQRSGRGRGEPGPADRPSSRKTPPEEKGNQDR